MVVTGPLVETKLLAPRPRPGIVARPRLSRRLGREGGRLVLVSAPAGFGKTTLIGRWLASQATGTPGLADEAVVAWVSLDEGDRDAATFWTYVVTALDRAVPGIGGTALPLLRATPAPIESVVAVVLNQLSELRREVVLALDDYHLADGPGVRSSMGYFVDHLPSLVRLVISTRADPDLPLARLRARGELNEVRAADLRFTASETASWETRADSISAVPMRWPETLITSSTRPVIQ